MSDYISREQALKSLKTSFLGMDFQRYKMAKGMFENLPSADVRENIHGEWVEWKARYGRYRGIPVCSNCNTGYPIYAKDYKFCPNCGADMRGKVE